MAFNRKETILDNLMSRTKAEINELRKLLDADVKSNLSKAEMAKQLAHYIRFEGEFWIRRFPRREVRILHQLASLPKGGKANAGRQGYATILEMMGFIVGEQSESGDLLYRTTDEIHDALKRGLPNAEAAIYCMNYAKYERYLMGLTNLYGIVPYPMAYESIVAAANFVEDEEFDRQRNPFAFLHESLLMDFYTISIGGQVYVVNPTADHPENVWQERQERDEFLEDYKKFTWQEIYDAGSEKDLPFVGENTPEGRGVSRVIAKLGITEDMADYMKYAFWRFGQESKMNVLTDIVQMCDGMFNSVDEVNDFLQAVTAYQNSMPKWCLMGRSSNEVHESYRMKELHPKDGKMFS